MSIHYLTDPLCGVRPRPLTRSDKRMGIQLIDRHFTPTWAVEALLHNYRPPAGDVLEPARGIDRIASVVEKYHRSAGTTYASDISDHLFFGNFIGPLYWWYWKHGNRKTFSCIITNPPFTLAQEFVERAHLMLNKPWGGDVVMLLRLGFLASKRRQAFWKQYPLAKLLVLSKRPSFREEGSATDASEYAWFIWSTTQHLERRVGPLIALPSTENKWEEQRGRTGSIIHIGQDDAKAFRHRFTRRAA